MELQTIQQHRETHQRRNMIEPEVETPSTRHMNNPFIEANTSEVSLSHLRDDCIVPVFSKDNEVTISHDQFIEYSLSGVLSGLGDVSIQSPEIRVSHQIKGRTPDAIHIPKKELQEHQKTIYYERMAWIARVPSITRNVTGNDLSLTVGGVRTYNHENLYSKKTFEKFKFFIGFQNMVCCNLCVSTDGFKSEIKVSRAEELEERIYETVIAFDQDRFLENLQGLNEYTLTENQFAQLLGKAKLYQFLPKQEKKEIPELLLTDSHFSSIARDFFQDDSFCRNPTGDISLWRVYNLFTGANKSSYINTFLDRNVNALQFLKGISKAISGESNYRWFLS